VQQGEHGACQHDGKDDIELAGKRGHEPATKDDFLDASLNHKAQK